MQRDLVLRFVLALFRLFVRATGGHVAVVSSEDMLRGYMILPVTGGYRAFHPMGFPMTDVCPTKRAVEWAMSQSSNSSTGGAA
jgi:hypothetical protein